jgi:hypothetical protein
MQEPVFMSNRHARWATLVLWTLVVPAAANEISSGLQPGAAPPPFQVYDATGRHKGKHICYRCLHGNRPVVAVFTRRLSPQLAKLVGQLDKEVAANKKGHLQAFVVLLTEDSDSVVPQLVELKQKNRIEHVPLTLFDGNQGPDDYNIAAGAETTVIMWNRNTVRFNLTMAADQLDKKQIAAIIKRADRLAK